MMPEPEPWLLTTAEAVEAYNDSYEPGFGLAVDRVSVAQARKLALWAIPTPTTSCHSVRRSPNMSEASCARSWRRDDHHSH